MSLLPFRGETHTSPDEPRVIGMADDVADTAFEALTASTTRTILARLYEQPSIPTDLRDEIDTSIQTVHYHLEKLEEAGFIEPVGVGYSERGTEMTVYAPTTEAVVLVAGRDLTSQQLQERF